MKDSEVLVEIERRLAPFQRALALMEKIVDQQAHTIQVLSDALVAKDGRDLAELVKHRAIAADPKLQELQLENEADAIAARTEKKKEDGFLNSL